MRSGLFPGEVRRGHAAPSPTDPRSRRISAAIVIQRPPEDVWRILTDYDRLSEHVPNLVASRRVAHPNKIRVYQEGAQKIFGFDFSASLVMDMQELFGPEQESRRLQRKIRCSRLTCSTAAPGPPIFWWPWQSLCPG